jgi:N2-citryl-N6-acetyl-N6-hydroxylysine synthase
VFIRRVLDSVATIADVLERPPAAVSGPYPSFSEGEHGLRFGHWIHPAPRSRDEFTRADSRRYGPEHGGRFGLRWWRVAPEIVAHDSARPLTVPEITAEMAASDRDGWPSDAADGGILVPVHPWQAAQLLSHPDLAAHRRAGRIVDLVEGQPAWSATSSLRTVHADHAAWMLKFSLSLRLTNSVRIVEPYECERGREVDRILASPIGEAFQARCPRFRIMGEPAHLSLRDCAGAILPETTVVFRDNPFRGADQPAACVLATLCEIAPDGRSSPMARLVAACAAREGLAFGEAASRWFDLFLDVAVAPCLIAQGEFGLLFGAHQQNLVVSLDEGWPAGAYFRDCQGTGYVREFLPWLSGQVEGIGSPRAHVFGATEAARLVGYYLFANSVFGAVAALAAAGADEDGLLRQVRALLERLAAGQPRDRTCLDYLLASPTISAKGNFMICFRNLNENTDVVDPLAGYVEQPNPIVEVRA